MKKVLIEYPYQKPVLLHDSSEGSVWFGSRHWSSVILTTTYWSTGDPGSRGRYLITLEPPSVNPHCFERWYREMFEGVLSFAGPWLEHVVPFRHPLPLGWPPLPLEVNTNPWDSRIDGVVAVMGNKTSAHPSSLYAARVAALDELHAAGVRVECWGRPGFEGKPWYQGELAGDATMKRRLLSRYRYCLCFENCEAENYVTEKLPEALLAGCFPIYRGAPNVDEWPFPHEWITSTFTPRTSTDHEQFLASIDASAISEFMSCTPLLQQILSLSS